MIIIIYFYNYHYYSYVGRQCMHNGRMSQCQYKHHSEIRLSQKACEAVMDQ